MAILTDEFQPKHGSNFSSLALLPRGYLSSKKSYQIIKKNFVILKTLLVHEVDLIVIL